MARSLVGVIEVGADVVVGQEVRKSAASEFGGLNEDDLLAGAIGDAQAGALHALQDALVGGPGDFYGIAPRRGGEMHWPVA